MEKKLKLICLLIAITVLLPACAPDNVDVFTGDGTNTPDYYPPDNEIESRDEDDSAPIADMLESNNGDDTENPFIDVNENATSRVVATSSVASYRHFCDLVDSGYTLSELKKCSYSFKSEEFLNYFSDDASYGFGDTVFTNSVKISKCSWNDDNYFLKLTLSAGDAEYVKNSNTVFYIDVSESMWGAKMLPMLVDSVNAFTGAIDGDDVVSLVTSAPNDNIVLDSVSGDYKEKINSAFYSLDAKSGANGHDSLEGAYLLAEKNYISGGINKVVLISDGDLSEKYCQLANDYAKKGIELAVVGLGAGNYNNGKLQNIANMGGGEYIYIDGNIRAEKFLSQDIFRKTQIVAHDLVCNISFDESVVAKYRLVGYDSKNVGEATGENQPKAIYKGDRITLCYELELVDSAAHLNDKIADAEISYAPYGTDVKRKRDFEISFDKYVENDGEMELLLNCVQMIMVLKDSPHGKSIKLSDVYKQLIQTEFEDNSKAEELITLLGIITGKIKK